MLQPGIEDPGGRTFWIADWSKADDGDVHGNFLHDPVAIVNKENDDGTVELKEGYFQSKAFWYFESEDALPLAQSVGMVKNKDRRIGFNVISSYEGDFKFEAPAPFRPNYWANDWGFENISTRVVDDEDPGRVALAAQGWKVVDTCSTDYAVAIPHGPTIKAKQSLLPPPDDPNAATNTGGSSNKAAAFDPSDHGGDASAGYTWDGIRTGLLSTLWAPIHPDDVFTGGREGTECGIQGLRRIAHFEWGEKHGSLHLSKTNLVRREGRGPIFSAALRHCPENKNNPGIKETGQWTPYYRMVYFQPEDDITEEPDGDHLPPGAPGGPGDPTGNPKGGDVVPPTDPCPDPVDGGPWPDPDDDGIADDPTPMWLVLPGMGATSGIPLFVPLSTQAARDNVTNLTKQGYLGLTTGQGPGSDKTVVWTTRDGTPVVAGFTVPYNTTCGLARDQRPGIDFGDDGLVSDDAYWSFYADTTGDFQLDCLETGSRYTTNVVHDGNQFQVRAGGFDLEYTPTAANFWSWNMALGFKRVPELTTAPLGGATFSGLEYRILESGDIYSRYRNTANTATVELLWQADAHSPVFDGNVAAQALCLEEVAAETVGLPPSGSDYVFKDIATGDISALNSSGGVRSLEGGGGGGGGSSTAEDTSIDSPFGDNVQQVFDQFSYRVQTLEQLIYALL